MRFFVQGPVASISVDDWMNGGRDGGSPKMAELEAGGRRDDDAARERGRS